MKVRCDYVTNSSSSSYIILSKVNRTLELDKYMLEEYGKYGIRLLDELLIDAKNLSDELDEYGFCIGESDEEHYGIGDLPDMVGQYLISTYYEYTTEGSQPGDDAWLREHLPEFAVKEIFVSEPD